MIKMDNPPKTELVALDIEGPICRITLNRESKYNAMNVQMITELCELFEWTAQRSVGTTGNLVDEDGNQTAGGVCFGNIFRGSTRISSSQNIYANTSNTLTKKQTYVLLAKQGSISGFR